MFKKYLFDPLQANAAVYYDRMRNRYPDDTLGLIATICTVGLLIAAVVFIISLPFALTGWAVLTVIGLFTEIAAFGYWATAGLGLAVAIVVNLFT